MVGPRLQEHPQLHRTGRINGHTPTDNHVPILSRKQQKSGGNIPSHRLGQRYKRWKKPIHTPSSLLNTNKAHIPEEPRPPQTLDKELAAHQNYQSTYKQENCQRANAGALHLQGGGPKKERWENRALAQPGTYLSSSGSHGPAAQIPH